MNENVLLLVLTPPPPHKLILLCILNFPSCPLQLLIILPHVSPCLPS